MAPDVPFTPRILMVDDEPVNLRLLERVLAAEGYRQVRGLTDPRQVLDHYRSFAPDLILLDLMMPHLGGIAVLERLRDEIPADEYLPVLVLTADVTAEAKRRALAAGARDFLTKPFDTFEVALRIANLLDTRRLHLEARRLNQALAAQNRSLEIAVDERTRELRSLFEGVPVGLFRSAPDARVVDANPAAAGILGYASREELVGLDTRLLYVDPEDRARLFARLEADGVVRGFECRMFRRDRAIVWVRASVRAVRDADGRMILLEGAVEDVTELRHMQESLRQSEKIATMGALLAGVAHELNNPLAVVMGHTHLLRETAEDPRTAERALKITAAAERCSRIVKNFLALARQRPPERAPVHVNGVVSEAVELLAYELRTGGVEVVLELSPGLPMLWADGHQLHQVLVNLLVNAHHAMRGQPAPRTITVGTRAAGGRIEIEVADTGPGIPLELHEQVFQPFFTTKPSGEGTGLGLSLCRNVIEEHGGRIALESAPGPGARFTIVLPVAALPGESAVVAPAGTAVSAPVRGAILVVDDEPDIAAILVEAFGRDGHEVDVVHDGASALDRLGRRAYALVVTDSRMPGMDGADFYREMIRRHPAIHGRVMFVTGDVLDRDRLAFLESTGAPFLSKPFEIAEVRHLASRLLAGEGVQ